MELNLYPTADARVRALTPNHNFGTRRHLYVGRHNPGNRYRSFVRFELPLAPAWTLRSARLYLYQEKRYGTCNPLIIDLYGLTGAWSELEVTWKTQPDRDARPTATCPAPGDTAWLEFNLLTLCRQWLAGERTNYGLALVSRDESTEGLSRLCSRQHSDAALWPLLSLSFELSPYPAHQVVTRDMGVFESAAGWQSTPVFDAAGLETVTAFAVHQAGGGVVVRAEISFDGATWRREDAEHVVAGGAVEPVTARHFARFLRLGYRSRNPSQPGTFRAVFQGMT